MNWTPTQSPFPHMLIWIGVLRPYQYVISFNFFTGRWGASAKTADDPDPHRARIDLGWGFISRLEAEAACERHALIAHTKPSIIVGRRSRIEP
jgi:hypothetical protein